ncbi:unnamed protein product [Chrysodeixis includens]|uniref:ZAD domain-containing protein n=1 Tax=Chrysodeixis includens TaxID=689277 RepID=A0A9P0BUC2_CHRIL|nr:unnamed protein product [Chrysodeixis includens]
MAKKKAKAKAKQPPAPSIPESITSEVIAEAYSAKAVPVFMKVCRLCESKDGPFLNIFDADKVTAKKIDELMPFGIAENDDLPHKICFRCSAKLEELYEFIQKCIRTQESLRTAIGKTGSFITKTKTRTVWEEKLNKTNMSNDDICDALIKKAMQGIQQMPIKETPKEDSPPPTKRVTRRNEQAKKESTSDENDDSEPSLKQLKMSLTRSSNKTPTTKPLNSTTPKTNNAKPPQSTNNKVVENEKKENEKSSDNKPKSNVDINSLSFDHKEDSNTSSSCEVVNVTEKPFNIMDYISMIKVNGVGVLFQCKLCNRNFLKKEVVESHSCAKNGVPKVEIPKIVHVPEPPKVSTVKYIKFDNNSKTWKPDKNDSQKENSDKQEDDVEPVVVKPKHKAGPASKTRRPVDTVPDTPKSTVSQDSPIVNSPSVQMPSLPKLNGRYKLVPGPNNIFTLVEDASGEAVPEVETPKVGKKRKSNDVKQDELNVNSKVQPQTEPVEEQSKPYPVGLFQTVGHSSRLYDDPVAPVPAPFTTPAMKKQSYTIVQTGNPSKLLISTKALAEPQAVPRKRVRKSKIEVREDFEPKAPYKVTLEDVAPPKDTGFFTFINVDPLLQPSYVLPTDNIIQESQISTSTSISNSAPESNKDKQDKYVCNMCSESFSREKKLLTHIQSHYNKMDEEDELRIGKGPKRKAKK